MCLIVVFFFIKISKNKLKILFKLKSILIILVDKKYEFWKFVKTGTTLVSIIGLSKNQATVKGEFLIKDVLL